MATDYAASSAKKPTEHPRSPPLRLVSSPVGNPTPKLSNAQLAALNAVYSPFRDTGEWPRYGYVDKMLDRHGLDAREVLPTLPPSLMRPDPARPGFFAQPADEMSLTVAGVAYCDGSANDIELFMRALRLFVELEERYEPKPTGGELPRAGSKELVAKLGMSPMEAARAYELMTREVGIVGSGGGNAEDWSFELRSEIRRFRGVKTFDDYLRHRIVPPPYPGLPVGAIVEQLEPVVSAFAEQLVPRNPATRLWWLIREDALLTTIVGGVAVALIVALIFAAVRLL